MPGVEDTQADLSVSVEVRVEADALHSSCFQVDEHRNTRVVRWEVDVEFKAPVRVRGMVRTSY